MDGNQIIFGAFFMILGIFIGSILPRSSSALFGRDFRAGFQLGGVLVFLFAGNAFWVIAELMMSYIGRSIMSGYLLLFFLLLSGFFFAAGIYYLFKYKTDLKTIEHFPFEAMGWFLTGNLILVISSTLGGAIPFSDIDTWGRLLSVVLFGLGVFSVWKQRNVIE